MSSRTSRARSWPPRSSRGRPGSTWPCSSSTTSRSSTPIPRCRPTPGSPTSSRPSSPTASRPAARSCRSRAGIVSRIEYAEYYLGVQGLRVQVDAAINPGNSGGPGGGRRPAGRPGLQPAPAGRQHRLPHPHGGDRPVPQGHQGRPLRRQADPGYRRPDDGEPDALRPVTSWTRRRRASWSARSTSPTRPYPLQVGDVLTQIGDHVIDNAGMVHIEGDRLIKCRCTWSSGWSRDGRLPVVLDARRQGGPSSTCR